jgi:Tfp pilus assembly protein PilN
MSPNLAARPFLNTRPVWLVSAAAGVLALALIAANLLLFVQTGRTLAPLLEQRDRLVVEERALAARLSGIVADLGKVPWKSLGARVDATNAILREHNFSWLAMLDDLERVMPYDVRLVQISPDVGPAEVELYLNVIAKTREAMIELLENLVSDPSFSQPTPRSETTPEESPSGSYQMSLSVRYSPPRVQP